MFLSTVFCCLSHEFMTTLQREKEFKAILIVFITFSIFNTVQMCNAESVFDTQSIIMDESRYDKNYINPICNGIYRILHSKREQCDIEINWRIQKDLNPTNPTGHIKQCNSKSGICGSLYNHVHPKLLTKSRPSISSILGIYDLCLGQSPIRACSFPWWISHGSCISTISVSLLQLWLLYIFTTWPLWGELKTAFY